MPAARRAAGRSGRRGSLGEGIGAMSWPARVWRPTGPWRGPWHRFAFGNDVGPYVQCLYVSRGGGTPMMLELPGELRVQQEGYPWHRMRNHPFGLFTRRP